MNQKSTTCWHPSQPESLNFSFPFIRINISLLGCFSSIPRIILPDVQRLSAQSLFVIKLDQFEKQGSTEHLPDKLIIERVLRQSYSLSESRQVHNQQHINREKDIIESKDRFHQLTDNNSDGIIKSELADTSSLLRTMPYSRDPPVQVSPNLPLLGAISISVDDLEIDSSLSFKPIGDFKALQDKFKDLKSCLIDYFLNRPINFRKERFHTPWENFVFVELCKFMKILSSDETMSNSFDLHQVMSRKSSKVRKKLKMFQMIYSKVMKGLFKEFTMKIEEKQRAPNLLKNSLDFFTYYFGDLARSRGVDIDAFNHLKCAKNANLTYAFLRSVFQSIPLQKAFLIHLDNQFIIDYRKERVHKIESMLKKWEGMLLAQNVPLPKILAFIRQEIKNKRFKFVLDDLTMNSYLEKFRTYILNFQKADSQGEPNCKKWLKGFNLTTRIFDKNVLP